MRKVGVKMLLCATMACACAPAVVAETTAAAMPETMAMLKHAIAAQTVAGQGQVPAFARYLAQKLEAGGFPASDIEVIPIGETAALVARYPGSTHEKPILLSAHMDVVPADASEWHYPPFHLTEANGHLYGRGTSDMKTNLVVLVETLLRFRREGFVPRRPLMLVFSGDEETAQATTSVLAKRYHDAEFVLNADGWGAVYDTAKHPVVFQVQAAEKSYADFALTVTSPGGHSSEPAPARNAIYRLARALDRVGAYGFPVRSDDITRQSLATLGAREGGALGKAMVDFSRDPGDAAAIAAISADPAYVGQIRTTCVATTWAGGHALNALPQRATANVNCRIFPGVTVAQVRATLTRVIDDSSVRVEARGAPVTSAASPVDKPLFAAIAATVHERYPGVPVVPFMSAYTTDSVYFRQYGVPSYGVNPVFAMPNDTFAHGVDERILAAEVPAALDFWHSLLTRLAQR